MGMREGREQDQRGVSEDFNAPTHPLFLLSLIDENFRLPSL